MEVWVRIRHTIAGYRHMEQQVYCTYEVTEQTCSCTAWWP